jgi:GNAT superfamily N-acetyltransferase
MAAARFRIRHATTGDASAVAGLAAGLAQSFVFSLASFEAHYPDLLAAGHACLLVADSTAGDGAAADGTAADHAAAGGAAGDRTIPAAGCVGYLLGFEHLTFYANGRVAWVEELFVCDDHRGRGAGQALMGAFEDWARGRGCALAALATRRAASFYRTLGYQDSAAYLRKLLPGQD